MIVRLSALSSSLKTLVGTWNSELFSSDLRIRLLEVSMLDHSRSSVKSFLMSLPERNINQHR